MTIFLLKLGDIKMDTEVQKSRPVGNRTQRRLTLLWSRSDSLSHSIFKRKYFKQRQTNSKSGLSLRQSSGRTPQNVVLTVMQCNERVRLGFF